MKRVFSIYSVIVIVFALFLTTDCKKEAKLPVVSTTPVTNITSTTATSGGTITSDGGATITANGVCWSTNANPSTTDSKTVDDNTTGQFVSSINGLTTGATYNVRAYATNSVGTAYGADMSFSTLGQAPSGLTQPATNITATGATLNGTVNANYLSTTVTFEYGITTTYGGTATATQSPVTGNSITNASVDISGLTPGTTYHYRIKTVNSLGTTYGDDMSFITSGQAPSAITQAACCFSTTGATLNGSVNANSLSTVVTFEYGLTTTYGSSVTATQSPVIGNTNSSVNVVLSGLTPGTTYHFSVKAVNSIGTVYGGDLSFTTLGQLPVGTTQSATNISSSGATLNGTVNPNYLSTTITFEYGTTTGYGSTVMASQSPITGSSGMIVSSDISGLTGGTTYHFRVKAVNSLGTVYGDDMSFTTSGFAPTSLTQSATNVSSTTSTLNGIVNANYLTTTVTFEYGISTSYGNTVTSSQSPITGGASTNVSANIAGLLPGTTYHFRVKAVNSLGTVYGNDMIFTTLAGAPTLTTTVISGVTTTTASSGGNITSDGGSAVTSRGVCWGTSSGATVSSSHTSDGTGSGAFTSSLTGLTANTTYYVRAYATNSVGTAYGNEVAFKTNQIVIPTLTTTAATSITSSSAVSGGNITSDGGGSVTARGVCWGTTANPTITNNKTSDGNGPGSFTSNISGLAPGTLYHIRAYATNSAGTSYGNDLTFITLAVVPTLTTADVSSITSSTAISGGNITADGSSIVTARGVCWNTQGNPTVSDNNTIDGSGTGSYASSLTGLSASTTYYIRAYATNSVGTAYGNQVSFTTLFWPPKSGLVAYYPFNGNANDESGNGFNGVVNNAVLTTDRFGNTNSAFSFGGNQDITVPNSQDQNLYPLSISLWYNVTSIGGDYNGSGIVFSKYTAASWNGYQITVGDYSNVPNHGILEHDGYGTTSWYLRSTNDRIIGYYGESPFLQQNISLNTWYHYVFVADDTGGKIYVNGELIDSHAWTGTPGACNNSNIWNIGGLYNNVWYSGKIDDICIYNRALTQQEITYLYTH